MFLDQRLKSTSSVSAIVLAIIVPIAIGVNIGIIYYKLVII